MPMRDTNLYPSMLAGQQAGTRNALLEVEAGRDAQTRDLLAQYTMSGSPDEKRRNLDLLLGANPAAAQQVLSVQTGRAALERQQAIEEATKGLGMAQWIMSNDDPVSALALLDDDETIRGEARKRGFDVNDPNDVREVARMLAARYQMVAGPQGEERAEPGIIREMRAVGLDPASDEGREIWLELKRREGAGDAELERLRTMLLGLQVQGEARDQEVKTREERETRTSQASALNRALDQTGKIADLTLGLEGTALAAGMPAGDFRRAAVGTLAGVGATLGFDTKKWRDQVDQYDQLKKSLSDQLINLMSTGGFGSSTNAALQQYQDALAKTETGPGAIMHIQAQIARTLLDEAEAKGYEVRNRDRIEAALAKMDAYETPAAETRVDVPGAARDAAAAVQRIGQMTLEQLEALDISQMTREAKEAAAERWDELSNAAAR
jgi:hypothetical protein